MTELDDALADFARHRSHELAAVIELLGRAALGGFEPPVHPKNLAFHAAWKELARDPARRAWCLQTILDKLPRLERYSEKYEAVADRLRVLHEVEPDPRIARAMLGLLALRSPNVTVTDVFVEIARLIVRHADDQIREAPQLGLLTWCKPAVGIVEDATLPAPAPLDPELRAKWAGVRPPVERDTTSLLAAVYASPDSDEPREILADALQEMGDPRGELVALQLREARGDTSVRERAQALIKQQGKHWLGELRTITLRAELRRGFLARLDLAGAWNTKRWDELAQDPSLATVEELYAGEANQEIYAQMLAGTVAANVRSIEVENDVALRALETIAFPRLAELRAFAWAGRAEYAERFGRRIVPVLSRAPQITRLGCQRPMLALLTDDIRARLTELTVLANVRELVELWPAYPRLVRFAARWSSIRLELVRSSEGAYARLAGYFEHPHFDLDELPESIQRIEVIDNATAAKSLAVRFRHRFEIAAVKSPSGFVTGVK